MGYNVTLSRRKQALYAVEKAELDQLVAEHASDDAKAFYHLMRGAMNEKAEGWKDFTHDLDGASTYKPFFEAFGLEWTPYRKVLLVPSETDKTRAAEAYDRIKDGDHLHLIQVVKDVRDSLHGGYTVMLDID